MAERKELSDKNRVYLTYIAEQLRLGFSGKWTIDCSEGGIRDFQEQKGLKVRDIKPGFRG